ncbi:MAG: alpha/beta hydrolase [Streptosporangiaceae bacterium]
MNARRVRRGSYTGVRVVASAVCAAVVLAGCTSGASGGRDGDNGSGSSARPTPALGEYYHQRLDWHSCGDRFQCARLTVPLDYSRPNWKRARLAVVRLPAKHKKRRIGSLVLNPGGPGGSGVQYARRADEVVSPEVRARFDIVGFDPRGVARSRPAVHCLSARQLDKYTALDASPETNAERHAIVRGSHRFDAGCEKRSGTLLPYVGTRSAARDMDVLRAALGDQRLTYLGKSYGTELGAYYAELFPRHVRALVLDGAVDPKVKPLRADLVQAKGFETALHAFVAHCVKRSDCPLGHGSTKKGMRRLDRFLHHVDEKPLPTQLGDGRKLNQALATLGVASALYIRSAWQYLRLGLAQAFAGDGSVLMRLADALTGRRPDGTYTNETAANMAVNCVDQPMPSKVSAYAKLARRAGKAAPHFGEFVAWGSLPCAFWPAPADHPPASFDAHGAPPILVVGTTRDPATPYAWAKRLAHELDSGVLLTRDGDGHTGYRVGNSCIDHAVDRYLITGNPPPPGKTCPEE